MRNFIAEVGNQSKNDQMAVANRVSWENCGNDSNWMQCGKNHFFELSTKIFLKKLDLSPKSTDKKAKRCGSTVLKGFFLKFGFIMINPDTKE